MPKIRTIFLVIASMVVASPAMAATIPVNSLLDGSLASLAGNSLCELREAVEAANTDSIVDRCPGGNGPDVIDLTGISGQINLKADDNELLVNSSIAFEGPGADQLAINGGGETRLFQVVYSGPDSHEVSFDGLTLTGGSNLTGIAGQGGGAIRARESVNGTGRLVVTNSVLTGNALFTAGNGGAINSSMDTYVGLSRIEGNIAQRQAGGIQVSNSRLEIHHSTIADNTTEGDDDETPWGGGIFVIGGSVETSLLLNSSTVSGNRITHEMGLGGGLAVQGATTEIINSTISGNHAPNAGAISNVSFAVDRPALMTISHSTIVDNTTSGAVPGLASGIFTAALDDAWTATVALDNTILDNADDGVDCWNFGLLTGFDASGGYNIDDDDDADTACIDGGGPGNQAIDPMLNMLADNGGPTLTHHPLPESPVIDAGDPAFMVPPDNDQRGSLYTRLAGGRVDIGAVERQPLVSLSLAGSPFPEDGGSATLTATLEGGSELPVTVNLGFSGDAVLGVDYSAVTSIVIPVEQSSAFITLTGIDDNEIEPTESILIDITSVSNGFEDGDQQVQGEITSEDLPLVSLGIFGSPFPENGGAATLTATLHAASFQDVTVMLGYAGTAQAGVDFTAPPTIIVPAGEVQASVALTGIDDDDIEPPESILVDITGVTNGIEDGDQQVQGEITSEDLPLVSLGLSGSPFPENGGAATLAATLHAASYQDVTVMLAYAGTATPGVDYTAPTSIVVMAGDTQASVQLNGIDDDLVEPTESIVVDIESVTNGLEDGDQQVQGEITSEDIPLVSLGLAPSTFAENGGSATLTASLDTPSFQDVTATVVYAGIAQAGVDFTAPASIVVSAGDLEGSVQLAGINDADYEPDEPFTVDIDSVINGLEDGEQQVQGVVTSEDPATATFSVTKDFSDDNPADVRVVIECNTGLPLMQEASVSEFGNPFSQIDFIVQDYAIGTLNCEIHEAPVPAGYQQGYQASADEDAIFGSLSSGADGCEYLEITDGIFACDITNTLLPVDVAVNKQWIDENPGFQNPTFVEITFSCNAPILNLCAHADGNCSVEGGMDTVTTYIDPANPGDFQVLPNWDGSTVCSATEAPMPGVIQDQDDCSSIPLAPGQDGACTLVNTRFYEGIPTLSHYGLALLALMMLGMGWAATRRYF